MPFDLPDFTSPGVWISLLTLCFLEVVLGIDNIIFISIVADKVPEQQQRKARLLGLALALVFRLCLLLGINWIVSLRNPVLTIPGLFGWFDPIALSWKDIILLAGGVFLIVKSTLEIHGKLQHPGQQEHGASRRGISIASALIQIVLVDAVFSFDSILTAIGLVESVFIMMIAVVMSILIMMLFAGPVSRIINRHPTLQMLALSFLILIVIGVVLIAGGVHQEVSKSIIYSCLGFSLGVEFLNIRLRRKLPPNDTVAP